MTAPGRYAAADGSFAKSAGSAAARGGILIGIALLIGVFLLSQGFDGGDASADVADAGDAAAGDAADGAESDAAGDGAAADGSEGDGAVTDPDPTTTDDTGDAGADPTTTDGTAEDPGTTDTVADVDPPASVTVAVLNATGTGGLAGQRSQALGAVGYTTTAGNAVSIEASNVFYTDGFADEAKAVAEALSGTAAVVAPMPADPATLAVGDSVDDALAADVVVVLGTDGQLQ